MDIVFINDVNFASYNILPQLGSVCLHNIIKKKYESSIINFDYLMFNGEIKVSKNMDENISNFANFILEKEPKIVSFYSMCNTYPTTILIAQKIRECNKYIKIIVGGPQATVTARETLENFSCFDIVGLGEAELYFLQLIDTLLSTESEILSKLAKISGIAYRKGRDIELNYNQYLVPITHLGSYNDYNYNDALNLISKVDVGITNYKFQIESGRGCPFNCTFCSTSIFFKRECRIKDVDTIINEISLFSKKYGLQHFSLDHDMLTFNKNYILDFSNKFKKNFPDMYWACSSRLDTLDNEMIIEMAESNCESMFVGFESGSARIQKIINKNLDIKNSIKKVRYLEELGIKVTTSFIYGFPDETIDDFLETINVITKLFIIGTNTVLLQKFMPLPKTVENTKVQNRYFDIHRINTSITSNCLLSEKHIKLITEYPDIFTCFYTYDSAIIDQYKHLDFLINKFSLLKKIFRYTIKLIIEKDGLINYYRKNEEYIKNFYFKTFNREITEYMSHKEERIFILDFIKQLVLNDTRDFIKEIYRFEKIRDDYLIGVLKDSKIYKFNYNLFDLYFNGFIHEEIGEFYILFQMKDNKLNISNIDIVSN